MNVIMFSKEIAMGNNLKKELHYLNLTIRAHSQAFS